MNHPSGKWLEPHTDPSKNDQNHMDQVCEFNDYYTLELAVQG